jgi:hypothetical protein
MAANERCRISWNVLILHSSSVLMFLFYYRHKPSPDTKLLTTYTEVTDRQRTLCHIQTSIIFTSILLHIDNTENNLK